MHNLALILFPGLNTEVETKREIERAGMKAEYVRWNDDVKKLKKFKFVAQVLLISHFVVNPD